MAAYSELIEWLDNNIDELDDAALATACKLSNIINDARLGVTRG